MSFAGRRVVVGVSGGIAAYKAIEVCRRLVDAGAFVSPVLTRGALKFVGKATFDALASEPARTSLWDEAEPIPHTRLGQNADLVVVCPATARVIADYRMGRSGDLLVATLIATRAPVLLCPAMHTEMWEHPSVQENLAVLRSWGVHQVGPDEGRLAGGDVGAGRMSSPEAIVAAALRVLAPDDLTGVRVLVTAGGTREAIDPVRVITNRSSGKQGYAIAEAAAQRGAHVTLVTSAERPPPFGVAATVAVESAADMLAAVDRHFDTTDVVVMAAAVADFRPVRAAHQKIKKGDGTGAACVPDIELEPTVDILASLGSRKRAGQLLVGFAAETENVVEHATGKLRRKNLDLIVANDVSAPGVGFAHETNQVTIVRADGRATTVPLSQKSAVAHRVLDEVVELRGGAATPPTGTLKTSPELSQQPRSTA